MRLLSLFSLCVAVATATPTDNKDNLVDILSAGMESFSNNLMKEVYKTKIGKNMVMSALSADIILSMTAFGAAGNTSKQMHQVLSLPSNRDTVKQGFKSIIQHFNYISDGDVAVELANKMYLAKDYEIKTDFKKLISNFFDSEIDQLDITYPSEAVDAVNKYVQNKTHGKIQNILREGDITSDTRMLLLNTIYFKSTWMKPFNLDYTDNESFSLDKKNKKTVPFMIKKDKVISYGVLSDLNATFVELPFSAGNIKMVIIVPDDEEGLGHIIDNLESFNPNRLDKSVDEDEVELHMPVFKIESDIGLKEALIKMGMINMFDHSADFSGITDQKLTVDKILQKATIDVNEGGCEAAAATLIEFFYMRAHRYPPTIIKVDKPFLFKIVDGNTNATIFIGTVVDP